MEDLLTHFKLGAYRDLRVVAHNETEFVNNVMNMIADDCEFSFDDAKVEIEAQRMATELTEALEEGKKPVRIFCYLNGIEEEQLPEFCKCEYMRGRKEDAIIKKIAEIEGLEVDTQDLADCRREYPEEYSQALFDGMDANEDIARAAMLAKKVLSFLMDVNEMVEE